MARRKKAMNRRTFLKGANAVIAIPLLDAMIPTFAHAQSGPQYRWVNLYYGSVNGGLINPSATGALTAPLKEAIASLEGVKQHISLLSGIHIEQVSNSLLPGPGEATQATHGKVESPMLSGVRSIPKTFAPQYDNAYSTIRGTTGDQIAAQHLGPGSKFNSLQIRLQASTYNNKGAPPKAMSVIKNGTLLNELTPVISPLQIYEMLFSGGIPGGNQPPVSSLPLKKKSVLDLVLDDATRLENSVNGRDKERLQQHFQNIRDIERSLASTNTPPPTGGSCSLPQKPGPDPALSTENFGGWANETLRGQQQANLIAHALSCGLTHVASWALTHHQVWLNSSYTGGSALSNGGGPPDIHNDSHNGGTAAIRAANHNWAVNHFGMLVKKLSEMTDAYGTILDHTFLTYFTAEGPTAHSRSNMTYLVAGCPGKMQNGVHIQTNQGHPAHILVSGLRAIGMNTNTLGEVSGTIPGLLK